MKRWKEWAGRIKTNRKLRSGGFSALLTAAVILCALLAGALGDGLEKRYALQKDFSFNAATTQSDVTAEVMRQLEKDVHIYAVEPSEGSDATLISLLDRYAAASPHLTYSRENVMRNPVLLTQFSDALGEKEASSHCLIVSCPDTGRARILNEDDYYIYSYNVDEGYFDEAGFTYEKSITEAILYVTQDELPVIQILSGHGELTQTDTAVLEETLISANYLVRRVNLSAGDELKAESPLMILSPRYDLSEDELETLMDFARQGGDFFLVSQYSDPVDLANFGALWRSYGVEMYPGLVIAKESDTASYYADLPVYLMPALQETDATRALLAAGKDILLLSGARAFALQSTPPEGVALSPVLLTGEAYIRDYADGVSLADQQETDQEGVFAVSAWADKMFEDGTVSHCFVIGNMTMFVDYWVMNSTDSTPFLLQMIRSLQGREPVNLNILPKNALRPGLSLGSLTPAVIVTAALPLLVLLGALLVLLPRKNL